jgi:hypothetical protein
MQSIGPGVALMPMRVNLAYGLAQPGAGGSVTGPELGGDIAVAECPRLSWREGALPPP